MQNLLFSGPCRPREALNHTSEYNQNHFSKGPGQLCFYEKFVLFSDPNVRPSNRPSPQKSAVTFDSLDRPARNFQGPLNSSQVTFGRVTRTPKRGFLQIYLLRGFGGRGTLSFCVSLSNCTDTEKI